MEIVSDRSHVPPLGIRLVTVRTPQHNPPPFVSDGHAVAVHVALVREPQKTRVARSGPEGEFRMADGGECGRVPKRSKRRILFAKVGVRGQAIVARSTMPILDPSQHGPAAVFPVTERAGGDAYLRLVMDRAVMAAQTRPIIHRANAITAGHQPFRWPE
jgi:hypothetical protein